MTQTQEIKFVKASDGAWQIRIARVDWAEGAEVTVTKANGQTTTVVCGDWMDEDGPDHYWAEIRDTSPRVASKPTTRPAGRRARKTTTITTSTRTASAKQVDYATSLLERCDWRDWHDTDHGQFGSKPTRADLATWTASDVSALIADLKRS